MVREISEKPQTEWGLLCEGKTIGVSCVARFTAASLTGETNDSPVNMLMVQGEDEYAIPLCLTLSPPLVFPLNAPITDLQNLSGSQENDQQLNIALADAPTWSKPLAIIEWGVGGASHKAIVDIFNGACVNLTASYVRARATIEGGAQGSNLVYQLAASVSPGHSKGGSRGAQRTMFNGVLANNAESAVFAIPKFAKTFNVVGGGFATLTTVLVGTVRFWGNPLGPAAAPVSFGQVIVTGNQPTHLPIPNGAFYYTVINQSGELGQLTTVFDLAI